MKLLHFRGVHIPKFKSVCQVSIPYHAVFLNGYLIHLLFYFFYFFLNYDLSYGTFDTHGAASVYLRS